MLQAMARRLPSLNALRAFETSARHESFTAAAEELFVTHAAVSRHVRDLEEWLGAELFERTPRGLTLTETGTRYAARLTPLFDEMADATRQVVAQGRVKSLTLTVEPAVASRWLVPRLGRFTAAHPDIELSINPENRMVDMRSGEADLGLRYGDGAWEDAEATKLSGVLIFPVCAPRLIPPGTDLHPRDLAGLTLLHEERKQWWADWLHAAGVELEGERPGIMFQNHLAIEAAEAGQGFALADPILATDAIAEGWLALPFPIHMKDHGSYWLVRAKAARETAPMRAFREWLLAEMAETNRRFVALTTAPKGKDRA
jgi:LysR family glycine cleavage system transcriptional activator